MSRFTYLRNILTGNVFRTSRPGLYRGTSNCTSDGASIYERVDRAAFDAYQAAKEK